MTNRWKPAALAVLALAGTSVAAMPAVAKKGGKHDHYMETPQAIDGRVNRVLVNPYGEADGLLLSSGAIVRFPAHMSDRLTASVRAGDTVSVQGSARAPGQEVKAWSIRNARSGQTVVAEPKPWGQVQAPKFMRYAALQPINARGTVTHVMLGKRGEAKQLVFGDGTVARLGKHLAYQAGAVRPGMTVSLRGRGTTTPHGRGIEVETIHPQ